MLQKLQAGLAPTWQESPETCWNKNNSTSPRKKQYNCRKGLDHWKDGTQPSSPSPGRDRLDPVIQSHTESMKRGPCTPYDSLARKTFCIVAKIQTPNIVLRKWSNPWAKVSNKRFTIALIVWRKSNPTITNTSQTTSQNGWKDRIRRFDRSRLIRSIPYHSSDLYTPSSWGSIRKKYMRSPSCGFSTYSWRASPLPHSMHPYIRNWFLRRGRPKLREKCCVLVQKRSFIISILTQQMMLPSKSMPL